ncbi:hypothetical protein PghCCS26_13450 [Paenibacillus glycanilyticus]|uniref:DUF6985 domain-containing protein n=1 Tax=Paenibacillus glycanilyticus TaxID=126569 RepID=A0ABQ6NGK8_9BACL|nr:hypothetical protein [Paenibacillus glycanilyticus]GMK44218.1 hypothetical protein PghCCS26_13450 [Paenibacillus glycanilyticus]
MEYSIPNLTLGEFGYEGNIPLSSWSERAVTLEIGGDMVEDNPKVTLEHVNGYNFTIEKQEYIKEIIMEAIFKEYLILRESYGFDVEEANEIMPEINTTYDLEQFIELSGVHILNVNYVEIAYIGYEFRCSWDEEHGLGVLTHKDRIVEVGGADTSVLTWKAEVDFEALGIVH